MNVEREAALSARICVLEEVLALVLAGMAVTNASDPIQRVEQLRTTLWNMQPQRPPHLSEDAPEMKAWRSAWEECLDRLFDRSRTLVAHRGQNQ